MPAVRPDILLDDPETSDDNLFLDADTAFREQVAPRMRGITPPGAIQAPAAPTAVAGGKTFTFDLYGGKGGGMAAPAPVAAPAAPSIKPGEKFEFNLYPDQPAAPAATAPKGILSRVGDAVDSSISKAAGDNKADASLIDQKGLADYKAEQAAEAQQIAARKKSLGTDEHGSVGKLLDGFAGGFLGGIGGTTEWVGSKVHVDAINKLGQLMSNEGKALSPTEQTTAQKLSGGLGSAASLLAPGGGVVRAARAIGLGAAAATSLGAGASALLESAGNAQETYDNAMSETGNKDLANKQAWKDFVINLPINFVTDKVGVFGEVGGAKYLRKILVSAGAEGLQEGSQQVASNFFGYKPVGEGVSENAALGAVIGGGIKSFHVAANHWFEKEATPEQRDQVVQSILSDGEQARAEIYNAMAQDPHAAEVLRGNGIESGNDPRFTAVAAHIGELNRTLAEFNIQSPEERQAQRASRGEDVQAAFGDTASTGVGIGTGAVEPVLSRDSVVPNHETQTLDPANGTAPEVVRLPEDRNGQSTVAMSGEDIVSRQQGFEVQPAFHVGDQIVGNRFLSPNQAETFLFGPVDKTTGERSGGYATSVPDLEFQIRQGQKSKVEGGGKFYFAEARPVEQTQQTQANPVAEATPTAPAPAAPMAQAQQAQMSEPTASSQLDAKKAMYAAYERLGMPADVVGNSVMQAQEKANERNEPMTLWESESGATGLVPASQKSPFKNGKKIATLHPETAITQEQNTPSTVDLSALPHLTQEQTTPVATQTEITNEQTATPALTATEPVSPGVIQDQAPVVTAPQQTVGDQLKAKQAEKVAAARDMVQKKASAKVLEKQAAAAWSEMADPKAPKWAVLPEPVKARWREATADRTGTMALADELAGVKKAAPAKAEAINEKANPKLNDPEMIETWEDMDDGQADHIAWNNLPKEQQQRWADAYADRYSTQDQHDQIVASARKSGRAEKANARVKEQTGDSEDATYRTEEKRTQGISAVGVRKLAMNFKAALTNAPDIVVVQSESELPAPIQQQLKRDKASGKVTGAFWGGKVYLIADNTASIDKASKTLTHEIAGHYGLHAILGDSYAKVMNQIYEGNAAVRQRADVMMREEGLSREVAVEEVLADMAEDGAKPTRQAMKALREVFAKIRAILRDKFGINFMSDNDVRQIVANARRHVVDGSVKAAGETTAPGQAAFKAGAATFHSAMERGVVKLNAKALTSEGWANELKGMVNKGQIKQAELDWTGVNDWLAMQNGKVSKEAVLDFMANSRYHFHEAVLNGTVDTTALEEAVRDVSDQDPSGMSIDEMLDTVRDAHGHRFANSLATDIENAKATSPRHNTHALPGGQNYTEIIMFDPSTKTGEFKADDKTHFGDATGGKTIAWLRMNERVDAEGNHVLFLEELQSQRAQAIRDGDEAASAAPMTNSTDAWLNLAMKRAIAYAAERGINRIAWTSGDQQNERYKLSKSVDTITYVKDKATGKITLSGEKNGRPLFDKEMSQQEVASFVGQDMAKQIEQGAGKEIENEHESSGIINVGEMEVGGEGMRGFYDGIVPKAAAKLLKQYGGKVGPMQIEGTGTQLGFEIPAAMNQRLEEDGQALWRRKDYEEQFADLPENVRKMAMDKGSPTPPTIKERIAALLPGAQKRMVQGIFDEYRAIKDIDDRSYMMTRLAKSAGENGLEGVMHFGHVFNDGGALNVRPGTKGFIEIMKPLGKETDRFMLWIAANRAGELKKQDREHYFKDDEIAALKRLNTGTTPEGKQRAAVYAQALREMNELNRSVLLLAKDTGLIDDAGFRKFAADIWYVPFYRNMEDGSPGGAMGAAGLTGQELSKKLKGSTKGLNDLVENVQRNWSHILSASMKNQAAVETLKAASQMGAGVEKLTVLDGKYGKDAAGNKVLLKHAANVMENGQEVFYKVEDEMLLNSLVSISNMGGGNFLLDAAGVFKTTLTRGVALAPKFKLNNLGRDSIQAIGVSELKGNPISNVMEGWRAYHGNKVEALVGGGLFTTGNSFDGDQGAAIKRLIKKGVSEADIITTPEKAKAWFSKAAEKYGELSEASENINRMALYKQLRDGGATHLDAAYAARDLQDFSLQGGWNAVRMLNRVLPYFNARLQGLYKLGRTATGGRQAATKLATVLGAVTLVDMALYLMQKDDDDWKQREQWDKDAFFWWKPPGSSVAIRFPKPFEIGAISSVATRLLEQIVDDSVEGKVFGQRLFSILKDNLAINFIPQAVRPMMDVYANKDGFTGRAIESVGAERLSPENRINPGTSELGKAMGRVNGMLANGISAATGVDANSLKYSPIQYDYLLKGYLGWAGTMIQTSANIMVEPFKDGQSPSRKVDDMLVIGEYLKGLPSSQSGYVTSYYENAKAVAQAQADYKAYLATGDLDKAREIIDENRDKLAMAKVYAAVSKKMAIISQQEKMIAADKTMDGDAKRVEMDRLTLIRNAYAKRVEEIRVARAQGKGDTPDPAAAGTPVQHFADGGLVKSVEGAADTVNDSWNGFKKNWPKTALAISVAPITGQATAAIEFYDAAKRGDVTDAALAAAQIIPFGGVLKGVRGARSALKSAEEYANSSSRIAAVSNTARSSRFADDLNAVASARRVEAAQQAGKAAGSSSQDAINVKEFLDQDGN